MHKLIILTLCLLAGCATPSQPSEQEKNTVSRLITDMHTLTLGRGLLDLPVDWRFRDSSYVTLYYGLTADHESVEVKILGDGVTQQRFDEALEERANRIAAVKNDEQNDRPMLVSTKLVTQQSKLLQYYESTEIPDGFIHELHLLTSGTYVMLKAESYNGNTAPVETRLKKLAKEILTVSPEFVGPGFAMGSIVIDSDHDQESAMLYFGPPDSDLELEISINALAPDNSKRLTTRTRESGKIFLADNYDNLRSGLVTLASMHGEEALIGFSDETHRQLLFAAENYRNHPSLSRPAMGFEMSAGGYKSSPLTPDKPKDLVRWTLPSFARKGYDLPLWQQPPSPAPVNPSLTDYEAMALWDAILESVRIRARAVETKQPTATYILHGPCDDEIAEGKRVLDELLATGPDSKPWKPQGW